MAMSSRKMALSSGKTASTGAKTSKSEVFAVSTMVAVQKATVLADGTWRI
jgi:hypothetical protein